MKRLLTLLLAAILLTAALAPAALAAEVCYPTTVVQSEDGGEIRKTYDLSPGEDPAGIPRSDFEQGGWHYTLTDLLRQETPEYQERQYSETVEVSSRNKDMESILALLPQEKAFVTDDGLSGTLTLQLNTVQVETAGYGSSTRTVTTTRSYPNLDSQDTQYIPKTVEENGRTMTLQDISWKTDNTGDMDGYDIGNRFTAVATYTGSATSSYVTGYTVTAEYSGTVSRIALDRVRYVAVFERTTVVPEEPAEEPESTEPAAVSQFNWGALLIPLAVAALAGGGIGLAVFLKHKHENGEEGSE